MRFLHILPGRSSLLRQIYYGDEDWSQTRTYVWRSVIPCGLPITDPRPTLGTLYNKLLESKVLRYEGKIRDYTDISHVFTGLEAMICPIQSVSTSVVLNVPILGAKRISINIYMPNEEFATWGGDLGSAAAIKLLDEHMGTPRPWTEYFGPKGTLASAEDLRGDIDSYAFRIALTRHPCYHAASKPITAISNPISQILIDYYMPHGSMSGEWTKRFHCFVQTIGGVIIGKNISNKVNLIDPISRRVCNFAKFFYLKACRDRKFIPIVDPSKLASKDSLEVTDLRLRSSEVTTLFLDWLENRL